METKPKVTFTMPVYNSVRYIDASILSVLADKYNDLELLAYDDQSDDGTYERLLLWSSQDSRIKVSRPFSDHGHYVDICNQMIEDAKGEYIARIDSDDINLPDRITKELDFINRKKKAILVGSMALAIMERDDGRIIDDYPWLDKLVRPVASYSEPVNDFLRSFNRLVHSTALARTSDLKSIGGYKNIFPLEDWDMVLTMAENGDVYILPDILCLKRQHDNNFSKRHPNLQNAFEYVRQKHNLEIDSLIKPSAIKTDEKTSQ
jgi:glycosyltransferase involved in cell wall biosynthesis